MTEEFTKIGPNMAKSSKGFTVVFTAPAGENYSDVNGTRIRIGTELYQAPLRQMIFANSRDLRGIPGSEAETILDNVSRALTFLGLDSEIYNG